MDKPDSNSFSETETISVCSSFFNELDVIEGFAAEMDGRQHVAEFHEDCGSCHKVDRLFQCFADCCRLLVILITFMRDGNQIGCVEKIFHFSDFFGNPYR